MRRALPVLLLLAPLAAVAADREDEKRRKEYTIKAACLGHFGRYVTWPEEAFAAPDAPFVICVLGKDPFGELLDALEKKRVAGRRVDVRRVTDVKKTVHAQIVFVSPSERKRLPALLEVLRNRPVLTVGETPGFARAGGIFNFFLDDGKVRFEINRAAARRAGLKIHPKLLRLGKLVEEEAS